LPTRVLFIAAMAWLMRRRKRGGCRAFSVIIGLGKTYFAAKP
jgi:hypothetical protein